MKEYVIFRLDCYDADFVVGEVYAGHRGEQTMCVLDPVVIMFEAAMGGDEMGMLRMLPFTCVGEPVEFSTRNIVVTGKADENIIQLYEKFRTRLPELRAQESNIVKQLMGVEPELKQDQPVVQKSKIKRTINRR